MLNLMVLHWGTITQQISLDCNARNGSFTRKPKSGSFCAGQDFDTIPDYNHEIQYQVLN